MRCRAELRPAETTVGVPAAVFVHGITGADGGGGESQMKDFKNYFVQQQPRLENGSMYPSTMVAVDRVQTGVRMERRLLKVLKGLAEYLDLSLGDLLEGIVLHAFEQKPPFDDSTVEVIERLKQVYGLDLTAADSHHLTSPDEENDSASVQARPPDRHHPGTAPAAARLHPVHPDR